MRARVLAAAVAWLASAAGAAAQPAFPESLDRAALLAWLKRETDILPDSVVAVTPQVITSVVSTFPAGGGQGPRVVIRAEALSADTYARTGALSWHVSLNADCATHRVKMGETTGYPERNLLGERRTLRAADADWRRPEPGTALDSAWRSACEKGYRGPLQDATVTVARPDSPPVAPPAAKKATPPPKAAAPVPKAAPPTPAKQESPKPAAAVRASPAAAAAAPPARRSGGMVVQVGSVTSAAEAKGLLAALGGKVAGRRSWVETAVVGGRTWHRAVVGGFSDGAEAARFCGQLKAAGRSCFVRSGRPG